MSDDTVGAAPESMETKTLPSAYNPAPVPYVDQIGYESDSPSEQAAEDEESTTGDESAGKVTSRRGRAAAKEG